MRLDRIAVLGAGSWGTALANAVARAGRGVTLWARDPAHAATLTHDRESPYLPGIKLDPQCGQQRTALVVDRALAAK